MVNKVNLTSIDSMEAIRNGELQGDLDNIIFWIVATYHFSKKEYNKSLIALENMNLKKQVPENYLLFRYVLAKFSKNKEDAKKYFKTATKTLFKQADSINSYQNYLKLGSLFLTENETDNALLCYTKAIKIDPNNFKAYNAIGIALTSNKKYELAEHAFYQSIGLDEENAYSWYLLGLTLELQKKYQKASISYNMAAKYNSKFQSFLDRFKKDKSISIFEGHKIFVEKN